MGESPKMDLWSRMDSSSTKNGKSGKGSFTITTACPHAPRNEKKRGEKQTDPRVEDKKEKQQTWTMYEYTKCILYFGFKHNRFSDRIMHFRIVKF